MCAVFLALTLVIIIDRKSPAMVYNHNGDYNAKPVFTVSKIISVPIEAFSQQFH